jgi:hypothetical protein
MRRNLLCLIILFTILGFACVIPEDLETLQEENNVNTPPVIIDYKPGSHVIDVLLRDSDPGEEINFVINVMDNDADPITYRWEILDCSDSGCRTKIPGTDENNYTYVAQLPGRDVIIGVEISDGLHYLYHYWIVRIERKIL